MIPIQYNLRNLAVRKTTSLASALGIALVVFVFSGLWMLGSGVRGAMLAGGREDQGILLRRGSEAEVTSAIELASVPLLLAPREIQRNADARPVAVAEAVSLLNL